MNTSGRTLEILMVEDNPGDARLTREALKQAKVLHNLSLVEDGEAAIEFLYQRGAYTHAPRPDLILLDLNLPKRDGRDVLATIKSDAALKTIPVVILTSSRAEEDILRAYKLEANCYITKPVDLQRFIEIVQSIEEFWLTIVTLPPK
jgi:two-component system, chemotaxis family, response regulator Rcp1